MADTAEGTGRESENLEEMKHQGDAMEIVYINPHDHQFNVEITSNQYVKNCPTLSLR